MYLPVALKLKDRRVVIFGGDEEATGKVEAVLACEGHPVVISPSVTPSIERLASAGRLTLLRRHYREGDLEGAFVAIACDPAEGERVRAEADRRGVLLNVLDQTHLCDYIAVATFARDGLQFAVHSSGKSAALSRRVRERLQRQFDERYARLTRLLGELRPAVRELIPAAEARRRFWLELVSEELLDRIDRGLEPESLREEIMSRAARVAEGHSVFASVESGPRPTESA